MREGPAAPNTEGTEARRHGGDFGWGVCWRSLRTRKTPDKRWSGAFLDARSSSLQTLRVSFLRALRVLRRKQKGKESGGTGREQRNRDGQGLAAIHFSEPPFSMSAKRFSPFFNVDSKPPSSHSSPRSGIRDILVARAVQEIVCPRFGRCGFQPRHMSKSMARLKAAPRKRIRDFPGRPRGGRGRGGGGRGARLRTGSRPCGRWGVRSRRGPFPCLPGAGTRRGPWSSPSRPDGRSAR